MKEMIFKVTRTNDESTCSKSVRYYVFVPVKNAKKSGAEIVDIVYQFNVWRDEIVKKTNCYGSFSFFWKTTWDREQCMKDPGLLARVFSREDSDRAWYHYSVECENKTAGELGFIVPEPYAVPEPTIVSESSGRVGSPDDCAEIHFGDAIVIYGAELFDAEAEVRGLDEGGVCLHKHKKLCICSKCGEKFKIESKHSYVSCPNGCMNSVRPIVDSEYASYMQKNYYYRDQSNRSCKHKYFFAEAYEDGVTISRIEHSVAAKRGVVTRSVKRACEISNRVKEGFSCTNFGKRKNTPGDPMKVLPFNSKSMNEKQHIIYSGAGYSFMEFASRNQKALGMTGVLECFKFFRPDSHEAGSENADMETLFLFYMAFVNKYPVIEQIVKSGQAGLFLRLFEAAKNANSGEQIKRMVDSMEEIINPEATKGKDALRFPVYIGDYLFKKNADIGEYVAWSNLYELKKFSREQFDAFIGSFEFAFLNAANAFMPLCNVLKYGYNHMRLASYLMKQKTYPNRSIQLLKDYLTMCEYMGVEPDYYPMDLEKQHDDMAKAFKEKENFFYDAYVKELGTACGRYVNKAKNEENQIGIPDSFFKYDIVFPMNQRDFINEGNMQHNCVGSYYRRTAAEKSCIIFFVRKKDDSERSFITGEYIRESGKLGQFLRSNNRNVNDRELMKLGLYVARRIRQGINAGEIPE